jgi:hypothetical protein
VTLSAKKTVTANYVIPTFALTVNSTNPASGVAITVSPADNNKAANGTTSFTRAYNTGTSITLTAPAKSGSNNFTSWTGCTTVSTVTCKVTLNAKKTVTANYAVPYVLTVNSTNPAGGVAIGVSPVDNNKNGNGTTSFFRVYNAGSSITLTAPAKSGSNTFASWTGCTSASTVTCKVTLNAKTTVKANYALPGSYVLTVNSTNPASGVAITVSPADNNSAANGSTSFTRDYNPGKSVTLKAPATLGSDIFSSWSGCTTSTTETCNVTMSANKTVAVTYFTLIVPTVKVTPGSTSIFTTQPLTVTVAVSGGSGKPTPTGSVALTGGGYTSAATALSSGSAQINIPANSLTAGSDTFKATYTPNASSSTTYQSASGTSSAVTVTEMSTVTVSTPSTPLAVTDQLLGMNLANWYDWPDNASSITSAFKKAGIKAIRWPGGSWSDDFHWGYKPGSSTLVPTYMCSCSSATNTSCTANSRSWGGYSTFANFVSTIPLAGSYDLALTANYGTNEACSSGGDPKEAAAWAAAAVSDGIKVSHMTVGNENYGTWETDLHARPNDPTTYAAAVVGSSGYYQLIKTASPNTKVGVVVEPSYAPWDEDVMSDAKGSYDFVEYHYYPQAPGSEDDNFLVKTAAQQLTKNIKTIKAELAKWGTAGTPIYVGEIGGTYSNPGKQSWSITQGLYAGQVLGEMMNAGVSRLTWWIGFGNCNGDNGNLSSSVYGWQDFGAYNVFADGAGDTGGSNNSPCNYGGPIGTMSPTARAFQLFSNVAVTGEKVLTATVAGDTSDVVAYAATHSGGTALVLFNRNEAAGELVEITISGKTAATSVTEITYDKALYDQTDATIPVWAAPTTSTITSPTLPLTLKLAPWSMNVVIIK